MYVYVMKLKDKPAIKIGVSVNYYRRLRNLNRNLEVDFDNTFVCKVGVGYREVEEHLHSQYANSRLDLLVKEGGTELFSEDVCEGAIEYLRGVGDVLPFNEAMLEWIEERSEVGKLKNYLTTQHELSKEWLEDNKGEAERQLLEIFKTDKTTGYALLWLLENKLDAKRVHQLMTGSEVVVRLSLNDFLNKPS